MRWNKTECGLPFIPLNSEKCKCGKDIHYGCYKHTYYCVACNIPKCSKSECKYHDSCWKPIQFE